MWSRLERLLEKAPAGSFSRLSDREVEDIGKLYRAAATHLSLLQAFGASVQQRARLNLLVSRAHGLIYGRPAQGRNVQAFFLSFIAFPETVRRTARYHLLAAALLALGGIYAYLGAGADPEWTLEFVAAGDDRTPYASREELKATLLAGRSRPAEEGAETSAGRELLSGEKAIFAAVLWQHNTRVAILAFFAGFLAGLPTVLLLLYNGAMLGAYSYTFHSRALAWEWWAWILPHGVTELLAIVLLAGGGLLIGHKLLAPGERSRLDALREARSDVGRLLLFAFPMLLLAAIIEAFVRQSNLSDSGRYLFAAASALLWALYLGLGRIPERTQARIEAQRTIAGRKIPLPDDSEILGALVGRRGLTPRRA
jgi:uncharacterized membrane protein SpoIIM required for sporulation